MSLFSWLRNLWKPAQPPPTRELRSPGTLTTIEYPAVDSPSSTLRTAPPGSIQLRFGVVSTKGNVREHNEDSFFVPPLGTVITLHSPPGKEPPAPPAPAGTERPSSAPTDVGLFVVADGMGGQLAGEKASSMAVEHIPQDLLGRLAKETEPDDLVIQRAIREAVAAANQEILTLSSLETEFANMGTTVVLALFQKKRVYVTGIGDSPAYRLRDSRFERLTRDHSLAKALEEAGTISREEVPTHKFKNVLYLYLGCRDARGGPEEVRMLDLRPGDRFLLATDGLTGVVNDSRIAEVMRTSEEPQQAARVLVNEALENYSKDNITCVVIYVEGG